MTRPCLLPLLLTCAATAACTSETNVLQPSGEGARTIANLTWALIALSVIVTVAVIVLTVYAVLHRDKDLRRHTPESDRRSIRWIVIGGGIVPAVILVIFFVITLLTTTALAPERTDEGLVIEVVGRQWWWQVNYTDAAHETRVVVAANEIHIPVGPRVPLRVTATDVIHSLWVPELQGKIDLIPGRTNRLWLQAEQPGVYRGRCAEFCGLQHAHMALLVVAHDSAEFAAWLAREAQPAGTAHPGAAVFMQNGCALCHTIRGTPARGSLGPDLTHVGSRREIAAGTLPTSFATLSGWIADPQGIKPGAHMPRVPLAPQDLHDVARYLAELR